MVAELENRLGGEPEVNADSIRTVDEQIREHERAVWTLEDQMKEHDRTVGTQEDHDQAQTGMNCESLTTSQTKNRTRKPSFRPA